MKAFYCDQFVLPLPDGHRFPMLKYSRLRDRALESGIVAPSSLFTPAPATDEQLFRCHDGDYVERVSRGTLTSQEQRRIGFPWSQMLAERARRTVGATIQACKSALTDGTAANLAGGTHHACRDHGEGYCVYNDVAVAARELQALGLAKRILIVDCDVHQGNGTAQITAGDDTIFTFSIHGQRNFPFRKFNSDLDIGLPDHVGDAEYLDLLEESLYRAVFAARADFAIYLSGADPYVGDRLGKLSLSKAGLVARDRLVIGALRAAGLSVAVTMGGGYAENVEDIVDIHLQTLAVAAELHEAAR